MGQNFPHRFAPHGNREGMVNEPIQHGIRDRRILKQAMPFIHRRLARNRGRLYAIPIVDNFEQVLAGFETELLQPPVIQEHQVVTGEPLEPA